MIITLQSYIPRTNYHIRALEEIGDKTRTRTFSDSKGLLAYLKAHDQDVITWDTQSTRIEIDKLRANQT